MTQCPFMSQVFYTHDTHRNLVLVVAKLVDDIPLTGLPHHVETFVHSFNDRFKLGSVASGPA